MPKKDLKPLKQVLKSFLLKNGRRSEPDKFFNEILLKIKNFNATIQNEYEF